MQSTIQTIRKHRNFSEDFKRSLVTEYEKGVLSACQLSKLYGISSSIIYRWIYKFSTFNKKGIRIVEMKTSSTAQLKDLQARIKELEQMVGQKQIKIEYLEKMIDIAKDDFQIDIKKNFNTPQSTGSNKTRKQ